MGTKSKILDLLPIGYIYHSIDENGRLKLESINRASETLTGICLRGDGLADYQSYLNQLIPENEEKPDIANLIEDCGRSSIRFYNSITSRWLRMEMDVDEKGFGLLMTLTDITLEMTENSRLKKSKEDAEAASRAKSEFLSNMSHEIRTPLNGVIGFSELLVGTKLSGIQRKYMENIHVSAKSLMDLINNILDFSKIEAGKLELFPEEVDLFQVLDTVVEIVRFNAHKKDLELILNIAPDLPFSVKADELRLRQVLINLISNAIKFTEIGEVELQVKLLEIDKPNSIAKFRFLVRDTGVGVSEIDKQKLFKAFSQVDNSASRRYGGSGLGLVISNMLLQKMNSKIRMDSHPGRGSRFFFDLALELVNPEPLPVLNLKGLKKVLVVDDHPVTRSVIVEMLNYHNVKVSQSEDGVDAIRMVSEEHDNDLIIVDYQMPYINGLDVIRKIMDMSSKNSAQQTFILLCSSSDDFTVFEQDEKLNIYEKLIKPVKPDEFYRVLSKIDELLTNKSSAYIKFPHSVKKNIYSLDSVTILLAEDDDINMLLTAEVVLQLFPKATLVKAYNGNRAVELYNEKNPDLILMDLNMPGLGGLEATRDIRNLERLNGKQIPIIALTAKVQDDTLTDCREAGMDAYVTKPIDLDKLSKLLMKHMPALKFNEVHSPIVDKISQNHHFNRDLLMEKIGGRIATYDRLIEAAKVSIPGYLQRIKNSIDHGRYDEAADVAHSLKGAAATLCLPELEKMAMRFEKRKHRTDELLKTFEDMILEWKSIEEML
ncbi:hybrid sensor histidine kinase/response regulator [Natronoflexus pectinivorans]|uniref:Sensory/regulatory protein RpfC n=1 Tax=Natronoflexus pectinivorans TaxID=682526 RepID=A0A4R2GFU8_9BACT|nr:hybrid sensor histidine kinase/response regulator [Natronoflexus pectinivorans]TCO06821.1 Hpt domain-containing protein [Natronoflexus pectinivorans]